MTRNLLFQNVYFKQTKDYTCGPATLRMAFAIEGKRLPEKKIHRAAYTSKERGTHTLVFIHASRKYGFHCFVKKNARLDHALSFVQKGFPVIVSWRIPDDNEEHASLLIDHEKEYLIINDPWKCKNSLVPKNYFKKAWDKRIIVVSKARIAIDIPGKLYTPIEG